MAKKILKYSFLVLVIAIFFNVLTNEKTYASEYSFNNGNSWNAKFYNNTSFKGTPITMKFPSIDFNWGHQSPHKSIPVNNFSAVFEKEMEFLGGEYYLVGEVDDEVRVFINNKLVYEVRGAGHRKIKQLIEVPKGCYPVRVEFVEYSGRSALSLDLLKADGWLVQYYNNVNFKGIPIFKTSDAIAFDWGGSSPINGIPYNHFSAEFEKYMEFEGGAYTLIGEVDDLISVYINDQLVYDISRQGSHKFNKKINIPKGKHHVRIKYAEYTGRAKISVAFIKEGDWLIKYFDNTNFRGTATYDSSSTIFFDWRRSSPSANISNDHFSAIFEKDMYFDGSPVNLVGEVDDLIKVYIDDRLVYEITKAGRHQINQRLSIPKGTHNVRVEFVEYTGSAKISLGFINPNEWKVRYYPETNFNSTAMYASVPDLALDWGGSSPNPTIPINNFAAIFEKDMYFDGSPYVLKGEVDDLIKVYVNNELIYEITRPGHHVINKTVNIPRGTHNVRVEFVEYTGSAKISLGFTKANEWAAKYFNNKDFKGTPIYSSEKELKLNWGKGSPFESIPNNHFSAIFEKQISFETDEYFIIGESDDLIRIYVDNELVFQIDSPGHHKFTELIKVKKGTQNVRVEFVELTGNARISLDFVPSKGDWLAKYYSNTKLSGVPVYYETINQLNLDWGSDSPKGLPSNNFSAEFTKFIDFVGGEYFITGEVDDLIKVFINDKLVLDITKPGHHNFTEVVNIPKGKQKVRVEFVEYTGRAKINLNFIKSEGWLAKYFNNSNFTGKPIYDSISDLNLNWGAGSPHSSIQTNNFSAIFEKDMVFEDSEYTIVGEVDDLLKVYIDNQLVYDISRAGNHKYSKTIKVTPGKHRVRVEFVEYTGSAKLILAFVPGNHWLAKYYNNTNFNGVPIYNSTNKLDFNWGSGSPDSRIPSDHFSASFEKEMNFESNVYKITGKVNDLIAILVDGELVFEIDSNGSHEINDYIHVPKGKHKVEVLFTELTGSASLSINFIKQQGITKEYRTTKYPITLTQMLNAQMKLNPKPQTDKPKKTIGYVREDALIISPDKPDEGKVNGTGWRFRSGPSTEHDVLGYLNNGQVLKNIKKTDETDEDGYYWYRFETSERIGWHNADPEDVLYYMNPKNFEKNTAQYLQFLLLDQFAGVSVEEVNEIILKDAGILNGMADTFIKAGKLNGINEIYLLSHALLETGNGTSDLAKGISRWKKVENGKVVTDENGEPIYIDISPKKVYNMFGYGAYDGCEEDCGAQYAYNKGWFTPEDAIFGGAELIADGYINAGQNTLYKMRWNPDSVANSGKATHQYASDIGWAVKQTSKMHELYSMLHNYIMIFDVPEYLEE